MELPFSLLGENESENERQKKNQNYMPTLPQGDGVILIISFEAF